MSYTVSATVANAARNISISSGTNATLTDSQATQFITEADQIINSKLGTVYFTPLTKITRSNVSKYPDPIPYIATRIAASLMVRAIFSRIDPQVSESAEAHLKDALRELDDLYMGVNMPSRRLEGQLLKSKNNFLNPYSGPLEQPKDNIRI